MSYLKAKYIAPNAIDGVMVRLKNGQTLRGRNFANTADINILSITTGDLVQLESLLSVNASLPIPTSPKQLATIEYIQNYVLGKTDAKEAVNLLSDVNVPLTGSTPLIIDSITATDGMRIALPDQTNPITNGVYDLAITGGTYTLTRSSDFDQINDASGKEVTQGAYFRVISGTAYGGWEVQLTTADPIVIGTTALTFVKYPSSLAIAAGDMIAKTGNKLYVDIATISGLESTNPGNDAGQLRVKVDQRTAIKKTTRLNPADGSIESRGSATKEITLSSTDVTNGFVDLDYEAEEHSVSMLIEDGPVVQINQHFTVNYTGGSGGVTRVTFINTLASAGSTPLETGEKLVFNYRAFTS